MRHFGLAALVALTVGASVPIAAATALARVGSVSAAVVPRLAASGNARSSTKTSAKGTEKPAGKAGSKALPKEGNGESPLIDAPLAKRPAVPKLSATQTTAFCAVANTAKAALTEIRSTKLRLGAKTPPTTFQSELNLDDQLRASAPKELRIDFDFVKRYNTLLMKLAGTTDTEQLTAISTQLSSDVLLGNYLDSTVRIEGFVKRTCGYRVGV